MEKIDYQVTWITCGDKWCELFADDFPAINSSLEGVYIIWVNQPNHLPARPIDVGSGILKERIEAHQEDETIKILVGTAHVTWAIVPEHLQEGVESFLADELELRGLKGRHYPNAPHIRVNLPEML